MFRSGIIHGNKSSESPPSTIADTTMEALFSSQASYYITSCYSTSIALPPHAEDDCNAVDGPGVCTYPNEAQCPNTSAKRKYPNVP